MRVDLLIEVPLVSFILFQGDVNKMHGFAVLLVFLKDSISVIEIDD